MAKKTKATRRSRAKKEAASKKKAAPTTAPEEAVIIAEGSDEPVVKAAKAPKKAAAKKVAPKKAETPVDQPIAVDEVETLESIERMVRPQRLRMAVSAGVLVAVLIAAVTIAALLGRTDNTAQNQMPQTAAQTPTDPDKLLESGGVCTNGNTQANPEQSVDPSTVGMMLQSVPSQQIQTPQSLGSSNDASTLQGASCF